MGSKDAALAAVALDGLDLRHFFPLRGDKARSGLGAARR